MKDLAKRSLDGVIIGCIILIVIAILVQFGLRPEGQFFGILFYVALALMVVMMILKVITNQKAITRERVPFLIVNIVSLLVLIIAIVGLKFMNFERQTLAVVVNYVALAAYCFTSLCLLWSMILSLKASFKPGTWIGPGSSFWLLTLIIIQLWILIDHCLNLQILFVHSLIHFLVFYQIKHLQYISR